MNKDEPASTKPSEVFDLTMMSNFIHQIINPLNGVAGTLDNLVEGRVEGTDRQIQRLSVARAQLENCITLVRNLAYFAEGFTAMDPATVRTVVIPQLVIEAALYYQEEALKKGCRIQLTDRATQNQTTGHYELVKQVFMNLIENAVKYSASGTEINIDQWVQRKTGKLLIQFTSTPQSPVHPMDVGRLFELGFRGQNAKKTVASGTGLGLYICKKIVEDVHKGSIRAEAFDGNKIRFLIELNPAA